MHITASHVLVCCYCLQEPLAATLPTSTDGTERATDGVMSDLEARLSRLEERARSQLASQGFSGADVSATHFLNLRYQVRRCEGCMQQAWHNVQMTG